MAKLNKNWATIGIILTLSVISAGLIRLIFIPAIRNIQNDIGRVTKVLEEERALLVRKPALESEWETKKSFFQSGSEPDTVLNLWVKDLLTFAQSQALTMEKLEPAGIKAGADGKELTVFISFQGDMQKFSRFIYQLMEKDPLSRVESFDVRREEGDKGMTFELMLAKAVK